jgi:hypothetical protein
MCIDLRYASIKDAQNGIQKCITWPKTSGKGKQAWDKAYADFWNKAYKYKHTSENKEKASNFFSCF